MSGGLQVPHEIHYTALLPHFHQKPGVQIWNHSSTNQIWHCFHVFLLNFPKIFYSVLLYLQYFIRILFTHTNGQPRHIIFIFIAHTYLIMYSAQFQWQFGIYYIQASNCTVGIPEMFGMISLCCSIKSISIFTLLKSFSLKLRSFF